MSEIKLPPLPPLHIAPSVEPVDYPEVAQALMDYARAAVEADRAARKPLTDEQMVACIKAAGFKTWDSRMWALKREIEAAHGISAAKETR